MDPVLQAVAALIPSIGVGLIFWFALRSIIGADRRERLAMARLDAEERDAKEKAAAESRDGGSVESEPAAPGASGPGSPTG